MTRSRADGLRVGVRFSLGTDFCGKQYLDRFSCAPSLNPMDSRGIKRLGREFDHPPASSAEIRMRGVILSISSYVFVAWCVIKHNFAFTFTTADEIDALNLS